MTRAGRLSRHDHRTLRGSGSRASSGPVTAQRFPVDGPPALGFAIGVGVGGAVQRNRIRRRLQAAARLISWQGPMIVSARPPAAALPFTELTSHLAAAADAAGRKVAR